jgi:glutamine cyclotransferase
LIYTDGGAQLHFLSSETEQVLRSVTVTENGQPVAKLNELEWVDGKIWANIWLTDRIVIIDPTTGVVSASINLQGLLPADERPTVNDVLNGIARDPADGSIWVTGKRWPWLYQIELVPVPKTTK